MAFFVAEGGDVAQRMGMGRFVPLGERWALVSGGVDSGIVGSGLPRGSLFFWSILSCLRNIEITVFISSAESYSHHKGAVCGGCPDQRPHFTVKDRCRHNRLSTRPLRK